MSAAIQQSVIDELRLCAGGVAPTLRELRLAIDCSAGELAGAVQSLRYQGKMAWDSLALSPSMLTEVREGQPEAGANALPAANRGPDDEDDEDYPGGVNDVDGGSCAGTAAGPAADPEPQPVTGFASPRVLHSAGIHAANTRAAARPVPAPEHEPEIARLVREETNERAARRHRARSTGTVRQPLELRKFGVRDMTLTESVSSMLVEEPHDLVVAVNRKHPQLWRRVMLLGRAMKLRPAEALYAVIERGLAELEQAETETVE